MVSTVAEPCPDSANTSGAASSISYGRCTAELDILLDWTRPVSIDTDPASNSHELSSVIFFAIGGPFGGGSAGELLVDFGVMGQRFCRW